MSVAVVANGDVVVSGQVIITPLPAVGALLVNANDPTTTATGNGADAPIVVGVTGSKGQDTSSVTLGQAGGQGARLQRTCGAGGNATATGAGSARGGNGGYVIETGGNGGSSTANSGVGGTGGDLLYRAGNGGSAGNGSGVGGTGGGVSWGAGNGGSGGGTGTGGTGGSAYLFGGLGGTGGTHGADGNVCLAHNGSNAVGGVAVAKGSITANYLLDVAGNVNILGNQGVNGAALQVGGSAPAAGTGNGAAAWDTFDCIGAAGGATSSTTAGQAGGVGASHFIRAGTGGAVTGASGATTGGAGGGSSVWGGTGGANASTGGTGGNGGNADLIGGAGGADTAATGTTAAGRGGHAHLGAGNGGAVSSASGTRGSGGTAYVYGGLANTSTGTGGTDGDVLLGHDGTTYRGGVRIGSSGPLGYGELLTISRTSAGDGTPTALALSSAARGIEVDVGDASGSTFYVAIFRRRSDGATIGSISHNGSTTSYNPTSDKRLKKDMGVAEYGMAQLRQAPPQAYTWRDTGVHSQVGWIAQDLQRVLPEMVVEVDGSMGVNYPGMSAAVGAALLDYAKQTDARLEALEAHAHDGRS